MLSIRRFNQKPMLLPMDEYLFNAIISKGRLVTNSDKTAFIEGLHISSDNQTNYIFKFSILESSIIQEKYDEFLTVGVLGRWKLNSNGYISLVAIGPQDDFEAFLKDDNSAEFVRQTYSF